MSTQDNNENPEQASQETEVPPTGAAGAGEAQTTEESAGAAVVDDEKVTLQNQLRDTEARLRTVSAAFRNYQDDIGAARERLARQAAIEEEIRRGEVVATVFEPVENLHRSINASKGLPEETLAGLKMIHQEFMSALKKLGLEEVPGVGSPFDPNVHEAIATMPTEDDAMDNKVVNVFSTGYRIGKRLVRPARVVIASKG